MANSSDISNGVVADAVTQYNTLRADVLNTTTGHNHDGIESAALALESITDDKLNFNRWKVKDYTLTATNYIWAIPAGIQQFRINFYGTVEFLNSGDSIDAQDYMSLYSTKSASANFYGTKNYIGGSTYLVSLFLNNDTKIGRWEEYNKDASSLNWSMSMGYFPKFDAVKLKFTGSNLIIEQLISEA